MDKQGINHPIRLLIAGGKTGGHLFPGIAVAQAVQRLNPNAKILFVGTGIPFEVETLNAYGFSHEAISSSGIKGRGILEKIKALAQIPFSIVQALAIIKRFKPDMVLGVGGYSSGPVVLAARFSFQGCITGIQEQNSIPGVTNRILARIVHVIFTGFKETMGFSDKTVTIYTGNPVRRTSPEGCGQWAQDSKKSLDSGSGCASGKEKIIEKKVSPRFTILVTGGSQGAVSINGAFVDAMALVEDKKSIQVIHQTGHNDEQRVIESYRALGVSANVKAFFNNMPTLMDQADLIVCRAGAGTLSEITAKGLPAILIPYPHAADDHQRFNAMAQVRAGAAILILDKEISGSRVHETLENLLHDPGRLQKMAASALALGMPLADETIACWCLAQTGKREC